MNFRAATEQTETGYEVRSDCEMPNANLFRNGLLFQL